MTRASVLTCLLVVLSVAATGVGPAAVAAAPADDVAAADGSAAAPTLVSVRTTLNETQPEAGANFTLTTHVENVGDSGDDVLVRSVEIRESRNGDVVAENEPYERLRSGTSMENAQSLELDEAGNHTLYVHVTFGNEDGNDYEVVQPVDVTVYEPHPLLSVETESTLPGSRSTLNLSVTNGIDEPIRSVELRLRGENVSVKDNRRSVAQLAATTTETFAFEVSGDTAGTATVTADLAYTTANGTRRTVTRTIAPTFTAPSNPGTINLTGISVRRVGQSLQVTGSASNVGTTDVMGVVVGVGSSSTASPGQSAAEYFVGEVPASDFSSFKVRAQYDGNASTVSVPLEVSYVVDDVRRTKTVTVEYEVPRRTEDRSSGSDSSPPMTMLLGGGLVGAVALAGGWRWFRGD